MRRSGSGRHRFSQLAPVAVFVAALASLVSACGVPTSASPQKIASVPRDLVAKEKGHPPPPIPGCGKNKACKVPLVYFVDANKLEPFLFCRPSCTSKPASPVALLAALQAGPTKTQERQYGVSSEIPSTQQISVVEVKGDVVTVNLNVSVGALSAAAIGQIVLTLTSTGGKVNRVLFRDYNGPVQMPTASNVYVARPLVAQDYARCLTGC